MAGEFIKDPPQSQDTESKKRLRMNGGGIGVGGSRKNPKSLTKSNGAVGAKVGGKRVGSGAATTRGGKL